MQHERVRECSRGNKGKWCLRWDGRLLQRRINRHLW
jgi:hypothetical protein